MVKRILTLMISMILIMPTTFNVALAIGTDINNENYDPYVSAGNFLSAIDVLKVKDFDEAVTRAEAADYIVNLLNQKSYLSGFRGLFSDVDSSFEYARSIEKLADLKVVRGTGNATFNPNKNLSYSEAAEMLMNVLGYGAVPGIDKMSEASKMDLFKNAKCEGDYVTNGDLYVMMYNALMGNPMVQVSYGAEEGFVISEQTMLYKVFGIVYTTGRVVKNDITYLWSYQGELNKSIILETADGNLEIFAEDMTELRDTLGKMITVYYRPDKNHRDNIYVYSEDEPSMKIITLMPSQIDESQTNLNNEKFVYYQNEKQTPSKVNLSSDYNIVYNGAAYKSNNFDFADITNKTGIVELIDADGNNRYETIKIKSYNGYVVGGLSEEYKYITDKFDSGIKVETDPERKLVETGYNTKIDDDSAEVVFIYDEDGYPTDFLEISEGDIISVAKSDVFSGKNVVEIHISRDITNGVITLVGEDGSLPIIELDGEETLKLYDRAGKKSYSPGANVIVYTDIFGNVIYVAGDSDNTDMQYGVILQYGDSTRGLSKAFEIEYLTASGEAVVGELSRKSYIDGKEITTPQDANNYLSTITTTATGITFDNKIIPMRYKLDNEGNIKFIDTVNKGSGDKDKLEVILAQKAVGVTGRVLGFIAPYRSDAVVLNIISSNASDRKTYADPGNVIATTAGSTFSANMVYSVLAYKSDENSPYADFLINIRSHAIGHDDTFFVVDKVNAAYNKDRDEEMYKIMGYKSGTYTTYWANNSAGDLSHLNKGDIIRVKIDLNGDVCSYREVLTNNNGSLVYTNDPSGQASVKTNDVTSILLICGYVNKKQGTIIRHNALNCAAGASRAIAAVSSEVPDWTSETLYSANLSDVTVVVVDDKENTVSIGSVDSIKDFENFGDESSLVIMRYRSNRLSDVVVYNK